MRTVDAVLFDFGGVVVASPFGSFARFEAQAGVPAGTLRAINSADPDGNAWAQLERGSITTDEFAVLFSAEAERLGVRVDGRAVLGLLDVPMARETAQPDVLAAMARYRAAGLTLGVLTNNIWPLRETGGGWAYDEVDAVVESCLVGLRKPDPAIYDLAGERLGVAPERTAFLDDLGINLKPARALGMKTIKVTEPAAAIRELDELCTT